MKYQLLIIIISGIFLINCTEQNSHLDKKRALSAEAKRLELLAQCLNDKGWVMYGSQTCSACRAQLKGFGPAFKFIRVVECNPHAPNSQVQLCLANKIKKTPTWIREQNSIVIDRIEGYQLLEDLSQKAECNTLENKTENN